MSDKIREALETARDDFHTLAISKEGDFDELGLRNFGSICEGQMIEAIALLTAEPEPCENARKVAKEIRQLTTGKYVDDMYTPEDEKGGVMVSSYASQVADKRAEELRGNCVWVEASLGSHRYKTSCGVPYHTDHGGEVKDGKYKYCPYCGKSAIVERALAAAEPKP